MTWNYDMDAAPRGEFRKEIRKVGKVDAEVETFHPVVIIVGGKCKTVTPSQWVPKRGAWSMFTKEVPPIAWQPWPEAPVYDGVVTVRGDSE